ncbi:MAG TPA: flagellin [Steroidobacteraceae bacterium]|nr:flagellin [Steroidobacteraceae bacterium]
MLDGSFGSAQFQIGANANQTISVSLGDARTTSLGAYQYNNTASPVTGSALASGDLTINGVNVGATANGSADTIVNAINGISSQTGVTATATSAAAAGGSPTAKQDLQSGDLVINGVNIGVINGAFSVASQGTNYVNAINAKTAATGVTATANATTGAISLSSSTGKTIAVTSNNGAAGAARVTNGTGILLTSGATAASNTATFTGTLGTSTAAFAAVATDGDTVIVNGTTYTFGDGTGGTVNKGADQTASAANLATAINTAETAKGTGKKVTASAATGTLTITSDYATSTNSAYQITGSNSATVTNNAVAGAGAAIGSTFVAGGKTYEFGYANSVVGAGNQLVVLGNSANNNAAALNAAVNTAHAATLTDVTSTVSTNAVTFTSDNKGAQGASDVTGTGTAAGAGVTVGVATGGANGTYAALTTYGQISLNSNAAYQVGGNNSAKAGLSTGGATLTSISTIDISSVNGANQAISLVDGALDQVAKIRADLGAVQNRFQSTINSVQSISENLSAARSRIQDADFAAETAALTKNQILQQAGVAILSQANSLPQSALQLLK